MLKPQLAALLAMEEGPGATAGDSESMEQCGKSRADVAHAGEEAEPTGGEGQSNPGRINVVAANHVAQQQLKEKYGQWMLVSEREMRGQSKGGMGSRYAIMEDLDREEQDPLPERRTNGTIVYKKGEFRLSCMDDIGAVVSATLGDTGSVKVGTGRVSVKVGTGRISVASSGSPKNRLANREEADGEQSTGHQVGQQASSRAPSQALLAFQFRISDFRIPVRFAAVLRFWLVFCEAYVEDFSLID
nr:hypothetical protein Iba_chr07cCG7780 [Ipomoea batatas]